MDTMVIALIGAGVCCFVIGLVLFIKLCRTSTTEKQSKTLLDPEYAENFRESFQNTGNIEDTLEELSSIYINNQYMSNLIIHALDYIRDGQGDYETALEGINVDDDIEIMKLHNMAIKKTLGVDVSSTKSLAAPEAEIAEEEFEEDEEDEATQEKVVKKDIAAPEPKITIRDDSDDSDAETIEDDEEPDDDDLDGFRIG